MDSMKGYEVHDGRPYITSADQIPDSFDTEAEELAFWEQAYFADGVLEEGPEVDAEVDRVLGIQRADTFDISSVFERLRELATEINHDLEDRYRSGELFTFTSGSIADLIPNTRDLESGTRLTSVHVELDYLVEAGDNDVDNDFNCEEITHVMGTWNKKDYYNPNE